MRSLLRIVPSIGGLWDGIRSWGFNVFRSRFSIVSGMQKMDEELSSRLFLLFRCLLLNILEIN